jgi:ubiquinone/menaquinone biosynthesis C-methylase UbiE
MVSKAPLYLCVGGFERPMPIPSEPRHEQPSAYFVADHFSSEELNRLRMQDLLITAGMGGILPEQPDLDVFQRVLDVGCGTGGWLIALAKASPASNVLVGVDTNRAFVAYARQQAKLAQVSDRVEFHLMDALRMLEFPTGFFDLVTHRFGMSWLRIWEWQKLLQEYRRVTRQDGIVRCVEGELALANSPSFMALRSLALTAFYRAGHLFCSECSSLAPDLSRLFRQYGLQDVQTRLISLEYRAGTEEGELFGEDMRLAFRVIEPFLHKWLRVPDDYGEMCQQAIDEMRRPGVVTTSSLFTIWSRNGS